MKHRCSAIGYAILLSRELPFSVSLAIGIRDSRAPGTDLGKTNRRSGMLPLKSLCIQPGRAVWVIYADIMCINYDGNVTDAALFALVAALKNSECVSMPHTPGDTITRSRALHAAAHTLLHAFVSPAARIPKARWDEDLEAAVADSDSAEEPLQIASEIYSASFGVTSEG